MLNKKAETSRPTPALIAAVIAVIVLVTLIFFLFGPGKETIDKFIILIPFLGSGKTQTTDTLIVRFNLEENKVVDFKEYPENYEAILKAIERGLENIDNIHVSTDIEMNTLLGALIELELEGLIQVLAGQK